MPWMTDQVDDLTILAELKDLDADPELLPALLPKARWAFVTWAEGDAALAASFAVNGY